ncbi:MAG: ARMT1-like domain-containing protein, partial [Candidatus Delongbacteria bacterium]
QLGKPVIFATREIPVINDITINEAKQIGINKIAKVISSGSKAPGTILEKCSRDFVGIFERSDMVISKGQGNYESLSDSKRDIVFLLKAKCPVIAKHLNVNVGDIIFKHNIGTNKCTDQFIL